MQKGSAYNEVHDGLEASISSSDKLGRALCMEGAAVVVVARVACCCCLP